MKCCICTTPIRPTPTTFPPFGSMAIIQSLRYIGEDVSFYNIDYFRYSHEQVERYFKENQFDMVGISAVVSTAYVYTKYLANLIRTVSPKTVIVVGGNLAASAEMLLRKCEVDFCVVGDGELIIRDLIRILYEKPLNYERLKTTKGLCFIDENDRFCFTGYGARPSAADIAWPDYEILEKDGSLPFFIPKDADTDYGLLEKGSSPAGVKDRGANQALVIMTKGCVARCTFCHRWEKGFRARPVDQVIEHVKLLKEKYDVGFIHVTDENFGSNRDLSRELATRLGELNIRWRCAGVRSKTVTKELLQHWRDNGCTYVEFGAESGSPRMLKIMEKNTTVEENLNALRWTSELGMGSIIQLIVGMPGENDETIRETIEFVKRVSDFLLLWEDTTPSDLISINFAQALPGTPLYEWAREHGYIGRTLDEEEQYLIRISDTDAYNSDHFINYTGYPMLKVLMWPWWMRAEVDAHHWPQNERKYLSLFQIARYYSSLLVTRLREGRFEGSVFGRLLRRVLVGSPRLNTLPKKYDFISESGYFNIKKGIKFAPLLLNPFTQRHFFKLLAIQIALIKGGTFTGVLRLLWEYFIWAVTGAKCKGPNVESISLRKVVKILPANPQEDGVDPMFSLRQGR